MARKLGSDLAWQVIQAQDASANLRKVAPTWSWASLPFCTSTRMERNFRNAPAFDVLDVQVRELSEEEKKDERVDIKKGREEAANAEDIVDIVKKGARVKAVKVRGHVRRFVGHHSQIVRWASILLLRGDGTEERYSFRMCIDRNIHSRNMTIGKVLVYEAHKQEVVGQLDYATTPQEKEKEGSCCVPDDTEKDLYCLEIGSSTMLFLEKNQRRLTIFSDEVGWISGGEYRIDRIIIILMKSPRVREEVWFGLAYIEKERDGERTEFLKETRGGGDS